MSASFTIVGGQGFIGGKVVESLEAQGRQVRVLPREYRDHIAGDLGHIIFCVGVTSDFRFRPFDTVEAHVSHMVPLLRTATYQSFVYLSSTRIYGPLGSQSSKVAIDPQDPDHLYNASKIAGEALCLTVNPQKNRVVRLSNVFGQIENSGNFLDSIVAAAIKNGHVDLMTSLATSRDYVWIDDAVKMIIAVAESGSRLIYDVAFGENRTTGDLMTHIARETGCTFSVKPDAPTVEFPKADISGLIVDFSYQPTDVLDLLPQIIARARRVRNSPSASVK